MAEAFFVRVEAARSASTGGRTFEIWIVATDDPEEAKRAVEAMVAPGSNVEVIHDRPSDETITRLALAPGQAWLLWPAAGLAKIARPSGEVAVQRADLVVDWRVARLS